MTKIEILISTILILLIAWLTAEHRQSLNHKPSQYILSASSQIQINKKIGLK